MLQRQLAALCVLLALPLTCAFAAVDVRDADRQMYPDNVTYDPAIPTPESYLGFSLGEHPVRHHQLVDYIRKVAELSDRFSVETIGYSHERRPILFLVVTSEENRANLEQIKRRHIALSEPQQAQTVDDDMPVVTWLNYGVHGAESSGLDAAVPFVYYLAAATGERVEAILDNSVILLTTVFNPDGHAKRIAWLDAYGSQRPNADPGHIEHTFNWQHARTNHYWFDLNRQWLLLTQPEPRAWMKKWHEWRPNLTVDYHEMGSDQTYYFHPGVATRTNPLVLEETERLMAETVTTSEAFLDSEARLYFHGERFDNYYVGKGSTFPLINGGVGILYEASATLGREIDTANGLRTYRENIRKHFRTSIASIEAASNLRGEYLRHQKSFYEQAQSAAASSSTKAWLVAAPKDPARLRFFADLLNSHRIKTYKLSRNVVVADKTYSVEESLLIPTEQAQHTLIRSIFEYQTEFEDATFYDVSTWTLPPAFGLQFTALAGRNYRASMVAEEYSPVAAIVSTPDVASYGYVFEWHGYFAPRALQRILENKLLAKVATRSFSATTSRGVLSFDAGSIFVPFDRQAMSSQDIHTLLSEIAVEDGIPVHALTSGRSAIGTAGVDLGGPSFRALKAPNVLLVVGDEMNLYDAGEIWHLMDYRMHMPLTMVPRDKLTDISWNKYTHIVMPSGEFDDYEAEYAERLRQWISEGGTLIGMRDAAEWVRANTLDWIDPESIDPESIDPGSINPESEEALAAPADEEQQEDSELARAPYREKDSNEAVDIIGGALFSATVDITHPLGFGYLDDSMILHKNWKTPMAATKNPYAVVIQYDESPVVSGYASQNNSDALANTAALIAERSDKGSVILFADNPNFRGYWYGTNKLFLNSLFFSRTFDAPAEE